MRHGSIGAHAPTEPARGFGLSRSRSSLEGEAAFDAAKPLVSAFKGRGAPFPGAPAARSMPPCRKIPKVPLCGASCELAFGREKRALCVLRGISLFLILSV